MTVDRYIATCPLEIQDLVCQELQDYGAVNIKAGFKAVHFEADLKTAYEIHLKLASASRILRILKESAGKTLTMITDQSNRVAWNKIWPKNGTYLVEAVLGDREHDLSSNDLSKAVRHGIEKYFQKNGLALPKVDLKEPTLKVVAFLRQGRLMISVDSSGKTLHKRGYRHLQHPAPIKETLAAACLRLMDYDGNQVFYDPMCGSGTIGIEAAYIALNKAPLIHRKKLDFGMEKLADFQSDLWRRVQESVRLERREEPASPIILGDIRPEFVEMAKQHALKARVEKHLQFRLGSFFDLEPPAPNGMILMNLPYGERLQKNQVEEMKEFLQRLGNHLKHHYQGWRIGLLAAEQSPYKLIGLKPDKKWTLLNGSIPCKLLVFDIYAGSRKDWKKSEAAQHDSSVRA
ncbi:MAG: THUMP domain-containing class I SAM-dependent RNA methyltransferase [Oligoflexus sp.]